MAEDAKSKIDEATEKAYAEAAAAVKPAPKPEEPAAATADAKPAEPIAAAPVKPAAIKKAVAPKAKPKIAAEKKVAAKKTVAAKTKAAPKKKIAAKAKPKKVAAKKVAPATKTPTLTELKDKIMATTKTKDFTKTVKEAAADVQSKLKAAYDKGSEYFSEATEFNKANVEALVESGKIVAGAAQEMGREAVADVKTVFETMTADAKKMAAVKSPTELFQLQGELARRNFDALVAYNSKSTEKMIKLANDAFAPVSSRISVAAEKLSKAA